MVRGSFPKQAIHPVNAREENEKGGGRRGQRGGEGGMDEERREGEEC